MHLGEGGAILAGIVAIVADVLARRRSGPSEAEARRQGALGVWLGASVLVLVVGLNVLFVVVLGK